MKAVVITRPGGPEVLEIQDRPAPEPAPSEIRVRVAASALNRADISQRLGRYPAPAGSPPDIPGLEYAGEVESVGDQVTLWKKGDRVMGIVGGGAHAELLCTHEREAMPVPKDMAFVDAAAIPEVFLTAYDAMFDQLALTAGETLLIHAAGSGVGTAAIQLAHLAGVRSIGTSRTEGKLSRAGRLGLDVGIVASGAWPAHVQAETSGEGVNAILDLVGAAYLAGNLAALRVRGRMISVGLTAGSRAELDMGVVMRKRLTLIGTVLRARPIEEKIRLARAFSDRIVPLFSAGRLAPVVDSVHNFEDISAAHHLMESNATFGNVVLQWS
jgi:putative PIG3 family NAD(P)H quinone oxidoreductase